MRNLRHVVCLLMVIILAGCVAAAVNTTTYAVKSADREELLPLAEAGDATAQYKLGDSYCCMGAGFSTQTATHWYCKSAHQGNMDAMFELGRVYAGDISRSVAPGQKIRAAISARESLAHAQMWLTLAAARGHPGAGERLAELDKKISEEHRAAAAGMELTWQDQPCEYKHVFIDPE